MKSERNANSREVGRGVERTWKKRKNVRESVCECVCV